MTWGRKDFSKSILPLWSNIWNSTISDSFSWVPVLKSKCSWYGQDIACLSAQILSAPQMVLLAAGTSDVWEHWAAAGVYHGVGGCPGKWADECQTHLLPTSQAFVGLILWQIPLHINLPSCLTKDKYLPSQISFLFVCFYFSCVSEGSILFPR